jgi:hypothetical protein
VFAAAVWALHFLAMLAYRAGLPIGYDLGLNGLSVAAAIVLAAGGFALAGLDTAAAALAGGTLAGLGIRHGTLLLSQAIAYGRGGEVALDRRREGLVCTIQVPLAVPEDAATAGAA